MALTVRTSLTSRPLDLLYFSFFLIHLVASVVVDLQYMYPPSLVPGVFRSVVEFYLRLSNDPLVVGLWEQDPHFMWFKSFVYLEAFFQVPVFLLGMRGLWKDSRAIYVLLLVYGASTTTTMLPCLSVILTTPVAVSENIAKGAAITSDQRLVLLSSYIPFLIIPLLMTVDMAIRLLRLTRAEAKAKSE